MGVGSRCFTQKPELSEENCMEMNASSTMEPAPNVVYRVIY